MNSPVCQWSMQVMKCVRRIVCELLLLGLCFVCAQSSAATTNVLAWDKTKDRVSADVRDWELIRLLEEIAAQTGWHVFVEPDYGFKSSVKFKDVPTGQGLRLLLGDMNYALMPPTNGTQRLYVFRTTMKNATQQVRAAGAAKAQAKAKHVLNELIVRVKPGTDIDQLAKLFGAKVTGRLPELDTYRLEFSDEAATENAKKLLSDTTSVTSVDYNYYFDQPQPAREYAGNAGASKSLQLKPSSNNSGRVVVGLIDTAVQPLGGNYDALMLKQISVAGEANLNTTSPLHGTSMAKTLFDAVAGVLSAGGDGGMANGTRVQVLPVDVYGSSPETTTWNVAKGIAEAVNNGATVLNFSLGGPMDSPLFQDLVAQVSAKGIPMFAAAGNEPVDTPFFPAAYPQVVAVTGGNRNGISSYANHGSFVDVVAPDANIVPYGNRQWYVVGTSAASAFTAGIAAGMADKLGPNWNGIVQSIQKTFPVPK